MLLYLTTLHCNNGCSIFFLSLSSTVCLHTIIKKRHPMWTISGDQCAQKWAHNFFCLVLILYVGSVELKMWSTRWISLHALSSIIWKILITIIHRKNMLNESKYGKNMRTTFSLCKFQWTSFLPLKCSTFDSVCCDFANGVNLIVWLCGEIWWPLLASYYF